MNFCICSHGFSAPWVGKALNSTAEKMQNTFPNLLQVLINTAWCWETQSHVQPGPDCTQVLAAFRLRNNLHLSQYDWRLCCCVGQQSSHPSSSQHTSLPKALLRPGARTGLSWASAFPRATDFTAVLHRDNFHSSGLATVAWSRLYGCLVANILHFHFTKPVITLKPSKHCCPWARKSIFTDSFSVLGRQETRCLFYPRNEEESSFS